MRVKPFYRLLRSITYFVLFFFCWSYLELFQIPAAYAATESRGAKGQKAESGRQKTTGEKFQESLDRIREAGENRAKLKTERGTIEQLDTELQKQFKDTEAKIKDLPEVIKQRHREFTKKYSENLSTLKTHLDSVEKAKTDAEAKNAAEKTKTFLESVRPQKRHIALDPNRLPHQNRALKTKWREPRLKEQFERDFPKQKSQSKKKIAYNRLQNDLLANAPKQKPVLLAFNGPDSDIPFSLGAPSVTPQFAFSDAAPLLLAQAADQPSADDLSETPEVQFTDAIRAKAQELGGKPLKIYEWVRNNIEYAPTYGSIHGADMCLQSKICNDIDTASLLISLLRVSGIYSHYEYSTIEIPIERAMNLVGGVTDPKMVGTILATNGIPVRNVISGGTIKAVQFERVTVSAFIDYIPSRGAVHRQGDTWIPLDPSFKQYTYTQGIDIKSAVPFDAQLFADQIKATATINETEGYVTNVSSTLIQQAMQDYQTRVQDYITQNKPNATVGDVLGKKEIIKEEFGLLPCTLPYKTIQIGSEFAQVPSNLRATMSFSIPDATGITAGLSYSTSLPQIAGKKITLSFSPTTANDKKTIETYLQISPGSLPAYLISLNPELRVDGQVVATGSPVTMGSAQPFTMTLNEPGGGLSNIDNFIKAGEYYGIGVDTGRIGAGNLSRLKAKLVITKTKLEAQNFDGLTKDDLLGDILHSTITEYFAELDFSDEISARSMGIIRYRAPSIGMFSLSFSVTELFGIPKSASPAGMKMDVDRIMQAVFSKDGNVDKVRQYMLSSGMNSSAFEHAIPEQLLSTGDNSTIGISALKALQIANNQGIPIYTITQTNISSVLSQLQVDATVKADIQNAVNAGKTVTVSKSNISFNGLTFCGYIIIDPTTNAGAYMLSNASSGAWVIGLIAGTLALFGIALIVSGLGVVAAGVVAAFIGAILVGLAIGIILSQILSDGDRAQLGQALRWVIRAMMSIFAGLGFAFAMYALFAALIYFFIMEIAKQLALNKDELIYLVKYKRLEKLEV